MAILSADERQSLYDQLRGTGGWQAPTDERADEIKALLDSHQRDEAGDALQDIKDTMHQ